MARLKSCCLTDKKADSTDSKAFRSIIALLRRKLLQVHCRNERSVITRCYQYLLLSAAIYGIVGLVI